MPAGSLVFAQPIECASWPTFRRLEAKHRGYFNARTFSCLASFSAWPSRKCPPAQACATSKPACGPIPPSSTTSGCAEMSAAAPWPDFMVANPRLVVHKPRILDVPSATAQPLVAIPAWE